MGAIAGGLLGLFNKKPKPVYTEPTDVGEVTRDTLNTNRGLLPAAQGFANEVTGGMQDTALSTIERAIPGFSRIRESLTGRALENLTNPYDVPAEVGTEIARLAVIAV